MKSTISSLVANLKLLNKEFEDQKLQLKKLGVEFKAKALYLTSSKEQELQTRIQYLQGELKGLIVLTQSKLASKSNFESERKKREEGLETLFQNLPVSLWKFKKVLENIKPGLSERLTGEEISILCQSQVKLTSAKQELEISQTQQYEQMQVQIPPQGSNWQ